MSVAAAFRGMSAVRVSACRGISPLADIPDRQRRDGSPQPVIRRKHPVVAVPVLARRRYEVSQTIEELKRREFEAAARAGWTSARAPTGLAALCRGST
jgi:hypothetical protein